MPQMGTMRPNSFGGQTTITINVETQKPESFSTPQQQPTPLLVRATIAAPGYR